jgi:hypothetical protein
VGFTAFALFVGISMSITAFPVLLRILADRGITQTPLGQTAIACAALGDATAWCLLALIVAAAQASGWLPASLNLLCVVAFVALMLGLVKPWFARQQIAPGREGAGCSASCCCRWAVRWSPRCWASTRCSVRSLRASRYRPTRSCATC